MTSTVRDEPTANERAQRYIQLLKRRWVLIAVPGLAAMLVALTASGFKPRHYVASASLTLQPISLATIVQMPTTEGSPSSSIVSAEVAVLNGQRNDPAFSGRIEGAKISVSVKP